MIMKENMYGVLRSYQAAAPPRLPLELRQHIYAIIFDSPRFVDLRYVSVVLAYSRDTVYRPKLEKLREMSKR